MPDEVNPTSTTEAPPTTGAEETGGAATQTAPPSDSSPLAEGGAAAQAEGADYWKWLESVPAEELRKHPRVAGIAGELSQRQAEQLRRQIERENAERAAEAERQRLRELRRNDPVAYAQEMDARDELEEAHRKIQRLRGETQQQFLDRIAQGLGSLPEWRELSQDDFASIATALVGKQDDEVLSVFAARANDVLASKRAARLFAEWKAKELAREREALKQEVSAELLKQEPSPDLTPPRSRQPRFDPTKLPPDQFDKWYRENVLGKL